MYTLLIKGTSAVDAAKVAESCLPCVQKTTANCSDVKIAVFICGAIVTIVLIVALSFLAYCWIKNTRLRKEQKAERAKEEKRFSLRKEYQGAILDILKPKDIPTKEKESFEEKETNPSEIKDRKERYIEELRNCIKWIDEQKK